MCAFQMMLIVIGHVDAVQFLGIKTACQYRNESPKLTAELLFFYKFFCIKSVPQYLSLQILSSVQQFERQVEMKNEPEFQKVPLLFKSL